MQAYGMFTFLLNYATPVTVFAYCYGRIFHTVRRQSRVTAGGRSHDVPMATTSRDPGDAGSQIQQQVTGAAGDAAKLSRRELSVLQTMIAVIVCFLMCWSAVDITNFLQRAEVSSIVYTQYAFVYQGWKIASKNLYLLRLKKLFKIKSPNVSYL